MAIAFDASSSGDTGSSTSLTFSHTCTGSNRILFVSVIGATTAGNITSVTYNGVAMTQIDSVQGNGSRFIYLFYLVAPSTGSNNVVITPTASSFMSAVSASYTGVRQFSQPDNHITNSNSGASPITTSLTTSSDNCWTILAIHSEGGGTSASTGSTFRVKDTTFSSPSIFDSNGVVHPAGSTSMTVTTTGSGNAICMASFAPVGAVNPITAANASYSLTTETVTFTAPVITARGPKLDVSTNLTSASGSITIASNPRRILVALGPTGVGAGPVPTFPTATFNGHSIVFGNITPSYNSFINQYAPVIGYYIIPDALAAGTYTITTNATSGTGTSFSVFYDVDVNTPFDATSATSGSGFTSPATVNLTANSRYSAFIKVFNGSGGVTYADGSGETNIWGSTSTPEGSYKISANESNTMSTSWGGGGSQTVMTQVTEMRWGGAFSMTASNVSYVFTVEPVTLQLVGIAYPFTLANNSFALTVVDVSFLYKPTIWRNINKSNASFSPASKGAASMNAVSKGSASFSPTSRGSSSLTPINKSSASFNVQSKS